MARELSATLEAQQKWGLITRPYVRARITNKWGGVIRHAFESLYSGEEDDYLHTAAMPDDGSLIRLRVSGAGDGHKLYYQRLTPTPESDFSAWTDLEIDGVHRVASCAYGAKVGQFYVENILGFILFRESLDNGATWGEWEVISAFWTLNATPPDAAYKPNGDICLAWFDQPRILEYLDADVASWDTINDQSWLAQTFTPSIQHTLGYVSLKVYRVGTPGNLTVSIKATDGEGKPTGADLSTGTLDADNITDDTKGAWYRIEMTPHALFADTKYAIVCRALDAGEGEKVNWAKAINNPYPGGTEVVSFNAGVDWTVVSSWDMYFYDCGSPTPYANPATLYTLKRLSDVWQSRAEANQPLVAATGASIYYTDDWNIVATYGAADTEKGVAVYVLGDGGQVPADEWLARQYIIKRSSTEPYLYHAPFVRRPDTTRLYFVENFTQQETQNRLWYSQMPPSATFDLAAWLEPVPMNIEAEYGLAFTKHGSYAWLTNANRVFRALATENTLDLTDRLLELDSRDYPDIFKGSLKVVIDNTGGWYDDFDRLGQQLEVGIGYVTGAGNEYSNVPFRWITKFKLVAPPWYPLRMIFPVGVIGTLKIETEDAWTFLYRYRTRRTLSWEAEEKSVKELLQFFIARCGLDFDVISQSDAVQNFKPAFEVRTGTSYRTAIKNLLKMVPDQLVFREAKVLLRNPTTAEAVDWTYHTQIGTALLVFRGEYGETAIDPNRAEVWGDTLMVMKGDWPQVGKVRDRLSRVTTPTYPDVTRAGERADAELRRAEILTGEESRIIAPTNCGLEPWDVLLITDANAGVSGIRRRVRRIKGYWNRRHWQYQQIISLGAD